MMTSLKIAKQIEMTMLQRIVAEGYGLRGKSKWIQEAIQDFLKLPNFPEFVEIAGDMDNLDKVISIRLSDEMVSQIDIAILEVRKLYLGLEGVKSKIIRASIIQRILRTPTSVTEVPRN